MSEKQRATETKNKVDVVKGGPAGVCAAEIFTQEKENNAFLFERKLDNTKLCEESILSCMF